MKHKKRNGKSHQIFSFLNLLLWFNNFNLFLFYLLLYHWTLHQRSSCTFLPLRRRFQFLFLCFFFHFLFIFKFFLFPFLINTHFFKISNSFLFLCSYFSQVSELKFNFPFQLFKKEQTFEVFLFGVDESVLSAEGKDFCLKQGKKVIWLVFVCSFGKLFEFLISLLNLFEDLWFIFQKLIFLLI